MTCAECPKLKRLFCIVACPAMNERFVEMETGVPSLITHHPSRITASEQEAF